MLNRRSPCHGDDDDDDGEDDDDDDDDDDDAIRTAVGRPPSGQRRFLHFSP